LSTGCKPAKIESIKKVVQIESRKIRMNLDKVEVCPRGIAERVSKAAGSRGDVCPFDSSNKNF